MLLGEGISTDVKKVLIDCDMENYFSKDNWYKTDFFKFSRSLFNAIYQFMVIFLYMVMFPYMDCKVGL